jgi:2,5-diketo-D-gluconate reductase A
MTTALNLNNGDRMPQIGLGSYPLDDDEVRDAVVIAADAGYRLFDTAEAYGNEKGIGDGVRATGLPRDEVFVTTKLDGKFQGADRAIAGLDASLKRLGLDYVDLLLIHWPLPGRGEFVSTWTTFEKLHASGRARSIGVSNFKPAHLETLRAETDTVPAVNQIQLSPELTRAETRAYHEAHGIVTQAWSPFGGETASVLRNELIRTIAASRDRTPSQIVLRWCIELGISAVPKSGNPQRIKENIDVFGFELTPAEVAEISALDAGEAAAYDSDRGGH